MTYLSGMKGHVTTGPVRGARRLLRWLAIGAALAYPLALACVILVFRYVGERWWVTLTALYLPRIGFALPLPAVVLAVLLWGPRPLLWLQVLSLLLVVFPLMGLNPGAGRVLAATSVDALRVVSFNVGYASRGLPGIVFQLRAFAPDLVLLQDVPARLDHELKAVFPGWEARRDGGFFVASRSPIREVWVPPAIVYDGGTGGAHFVRYTLETPVGSADVFNMHTTSPRQGLEDVRGNGLRDGLVSGRLFAPRAGALAEYNAYRRRRQVEGLAAAAGGSARAVIIAGDTNLPGLSWIFGECLGRFRDAFAHAGRGFGYTFPAGRPWMRIDRILTNPWLRAIDFRVGDAVISDHRCVFAVLAANR